jgi:hypothetical protein
MGYATTTLMKLCNFELLVQSQLKLLLTCSYLIDYLSNSHSIELQPLAYELHTMLELSANIVSFMVPLATRFEYVELQPFQSSLTLVDLDIMCGVIVEFGTC